jgi:hypothetical protein
MEDELGEMDVFILFIVEMETMIEGVIFVLLLLYSEIWLIVFLFHSVVFTFLILLTIS